MLFKECFKIHIIEYRANQGNVFPKKSSYCKDHAIQGFVNQGPTVVGSQYGPNHLVLFNKSSPHLYVICLMSRWTMILRSISDAMKN